MNPTSKKLVWMYQKNKHLIDALILGRAPEFVARRKPPRDLDHIPVFTFHVAIPERFEKQCAHLADNGYHTMSAEEFRGVMFGKIKPKKNSVLLTFDDGLKQVWSVAYPILEKYGLCATVFLVPGCIKDGESALRPTMHDVWHGNAEEREVFGIADGETSLATWPEIEQMHKSGILDFQSHSMWHSLVFRSSKIVDFGRPDYDRHYFGNIHVPLYQIDRKDATDREVLLGMPLYESAPRMQTESRYFDNQELRMHCVEYVAKEGGEAFFDLTDWQQRLRQQVDEYKVRNQSVDNFETPGERDSAIKQELAEAKSDIESHLPGKGVDQLCFPWYRGNEFAQRCAVETGHTIMYFDREPDILANLPGSRDGRIARVDETWLRRLPGSGRMSKREVVEEVIGLRGLRSRMFPETQ